MQNDSKRSSAICVLIGLFTAAGAHSQQPAPAANPATGGTPAVQPGAAAPTTPAAGQPAPGNPGATSTTLDYLYNRKPGDGTAAQNGGNTAGTLQQKAMAADMLSGAENLIPPLLESYLNSAEASMEEVKKYFDLLKKTLDLLKDNNKVPEAVTNLYLLSEYPWDAGISRQLANRIMSFWDMIKNTRYLDQVNQQVYQKQIRDSSRNADHISDNIWDKQMERTRKQNLVGAKASGGGNQSSGSNSKDGNAGSKAFLPQAKEVDGLMGKLQLTEEYFSNLDARAKMKLNEKQILDIDKRARADFKQFVSVLFQDNRHYHARIAADFYRVLFGDGDLPTEVLKAATASSEIIRQTESDIEVFKFKVEQNKTASAAKMLREAFFRSPFHPAFQTVMRQQKLHVADYYEQLQQVQGMIEAKDFVKLEGKLQQIEKEVIDFDGTKPRALVEGVKRESQMRLGMAKLAAQQGSLDKAMEEFKTAATIWPGNPDLEKASQQFFSSQDMKTQGTDDFDRAIKENNYRLVFDKQLQFAPSIHGDAKREEQMKKALEKVKAAEMAYEKAALFDRNRDPYGAWEALDIASEEWPDDNKLNRMRADVAVKATEFVSSISRAREAEQRGADGYALTWFLNAQRQYPPSRLANDGIQRVSDVVLGKASRATLKSKASEKPADTPPAPAANPIPPVTAKTAST